MQRKSWLAGLYFLAAAVWATAAQCQPLILAANPQAPFKFEQDGQLQGIDIEIMRTVLDRLEIDYQVRLIKSDKRLQIEAKAGRIDMLLLYSKNEARQVYLEYPEESYVDLNWNFFIRSADQGKFTYTTLDDLKHLRIGATQGISYTEEFWNAGLQLDLEAENSLQMNKLLAGRIDAVPLNTIATLYRAQIGGYRDQISFLPKPMKSKAYFNVFSKTSAHPEMARLKANYDRIIRQLIEDGTIDKVKQRYIGSSS
ncbi:ABC transporter substrate-binding protein [Labrenzia sp. PHM005]|uniref:substrate-binding periplasmic protein n=1 Tax=Labrenzia sp. PHM005 TaxID=2590016 RepID=UPI0011401ADA|nr:transporter substrate-binding domain-containing protein [Labrenzia sp. PHM005]QDG78696.1 amino acid ABC transporter substrate-binding protein [Labrenzia sp. PHM005]